MNTSLNQDGPRTLHGMIAGAVMAAGLTGLAAALPGAATAQDYPEKPISLVVPYPAGGAIDSSARRVAEFLSDELGQPVLIVNREGANSVVGSTHVAQSDPDGYTFLYTTLVAQAGNIYSYENLPYDTFEDFTPVTAIQAPPNVLVAHPSVPAENFDELVDHVHENPGEVTFGTNGPGSPAFLRGMQMMRLGDLDLSLIAYPGGAAALADLVGGHLDLYPAQYPAIISFLEEGQVKVLAALGDTRIDALPDVPSITETEGFQPFRELATFPLVLAPAGTPEEIVAEVQEAFASVIANEEFLEVSAASHEYPPFAASSDEAGQMLREYVDLIGSLSE